MIKSVVFGPPTVGGKDFVLSLGGRISGTITNAATGAPLTFGASATIFNASGISLGAINIDGTGNFITSGLPIGSYYVRTTNSLGLVDELYDNVPCVPLCSLTAGTPVVVAAGTIRKRCLPEVTVK